MLGQGVVLSRVLTLEGQNCPIDLVDLAISGEAELRKPMWSPGQWARAPKVVDGRLGFTQLAAVLVFQLESSWAIHRVVDDYVVGRLEPDNVAASSADCRPAIK